VYSARFSAFTTPCEIFIDVKTQKEGDSILSLLLPKIKHFQKEYSFFDTTSQLYAINHRKYDSLTISKELSALLHLSQFYTNITQGAFDIALAGTLKATHNATTLEAYRTLYTTLIPFASSRSFTLEGTTLHFSNPYTKIDLGGIVKEYAVDQTIVWLQRLGISAALVNFGGDIAAYGMCEKEPWRIGIQDPKNPAINVTSVELYDASLCTSGHSKRYSCIEEQHFSHIIAPNKTSLDPLHQISIIAPTTVDAGIWSTALLINPLLKVPEHIFKVFEITEDR
jgi:FAD:protein FMN transferase